MADQVTLTIDGRTVQAPAGMLLIDAAKQAGIEIPSFCYYEWLTLQAACRMCLVEIEKAPKLMVACTTPVAEGMIVRTETPQVAAARKMTLEFLLTNHPLDCPVCDKGGECELQDMVFRYGAGESRFSEMKHHVDEKQWSPVVFYDGPRCILCYRCIRICNEGMGVGALGIQNRGVLAEILPNQHDHLECDECGACIDICPVGALTSGTYRYQTRPWEMQHVGTICAHCGDGCKTTLGVRNGEILRGNNRDRSGINDEFLCIKGRYAFDFVHREERLQSPLKRTASGFEPIAWSEALATVAAKFREIRERGGKFGVIGSNHTTNEENAYLRGFARSGLGTANLDHRRTGDVGALAAAGRPTVTAADLYEAKSILIIGSDLSQQHPFLAYQIRANKRHHNAKIFVVTPGPVREDNYSAKSVRAAAGAEFEALHQLADALKGGGDLVVLFGDAIQGEAVRRLVEFGDSLGIPVKYAALVDYSNSRGAFDAGVVPGPGGLTYDAMLDATDLDAVWVVGSNPLRNRALQSVGAFVVVQDLFLTETAQRADIVFPAASAYEKSGTVTNTMGETQKLKAAAKVMGVKTDLEIMRLIAREMGLAGDWAASELGTAASRIQSAGDTLFTSGTLGRYCKTLQAVIEAPGALYRGA